jgi:predicted nucleotidyltransferase
VEWQSFSRFENSKKERSREKIEMEVWSVETVVRALNEAGVRYLIVGGLAVNAHGYERLTRDIDLVFSLEPENVLTGVRALAELGYMPRVPVLAEELADAAKREVWRVEKNMMVLPLWSQKHERTPVDIFIEEPFEFAEEFTRATEVEVAEGLWAPVVALEALVRMKESAGRLQDLADIEALREMRACSEGNEKND